MKVVSWYDLEEVYYGKKEDIKISDKDLAILFCDLKQEIEELREEMKNIKNKQS